VAVRRGLLSLQDLPDGNDVICLHSDHHRVHGGALPGDLPLSARAGNFRFIAGSACRGRRLGDSLHHGHSVPDTHSHLLLRSASDHRTTSGRLAHLHHSRAVDAEHEIRLSGTN